MTYILILFIGMRVCSYIRILNGCFDREDTISSEEHFVLYILMKCYSPVFVYNITALLLFIFFFFDKLELCPKFKVKLGPEVFYPVHEVGPSHSRDIENSNSVTIAYSY